MSIDTTDGAFEAREAYLDRLGADISADEIEWPYDSEQDAIRRANQHAKRIEDTEAYWKGAY